MERQSPFMVPLAYRFQPNTFLKKFVVALKIYFGPSTYEDPIRAFMKLHQTTLMEEYQTPFEIQSNQIFWISKEFRINNFLSGFRDDLWIIATMLIKPNTLSKAFRLAHLQEEDVKHKTPKLIIIYPSLRPSS